MAEQPQWRVEKYEDPMDPFATTQWYVLQGNLVIAQCEIPSYAERIVLEHDRYTAFRQALEQISGMTSASGDLRAAVGKAKAALDGRGD